MSNRNYFNRYSLFTVDSQHKIVPGINVPIRGSDKFHLFKKNKDRLDKLSQEYYGSAVFGWLILAANPSSGLNEFEVQDNFFLRIPFPLTNALQDYKREVENYKLYYGE